MDAILKVENLSHKYSSAWAIREINFEINGTGVIGLLGSNGAAKSTTMNIICGTLLQTDGEVYINGISMRKNAVAYKKQIGFLPQQAPLYPDCTVEEYLTYTAQLRLIEDGRIKQAVAAVMEKTGITQMRSRLIKNLSGGYKQRVGISQAIIHDPKVVILDEPTNGLDPNQILEARKLIKSIAVDRIVLLSSHVLSEISMMAREIIMIENGKIVFSDTLDAFNNILQPSTLLVELLNMPEESALLKIEGVMKVEPLSSTTCRIHFSAIAGLAERIVQHSVAHNWRLEAISVEKSIMDDVFKQLSSATPSTH